MSESTAPTMETLVSLSKRRGFVFQASEIYGGIAGFWDYGPYGVELVRNIKDLWWRTYVDSQINIVGVDTTIVQNPMLWKASGHVDTFVDPMIDCKSCKHRFRADHVAGLDTSDLAKLNEALKDKSCPKCGKKHTFTEAKVFNLMLKTYLGPVEDDAAVAYLRPETAGSIFTQYENVRETTRQKLPFGIAQIGKAFRNEITPKDFVFRVRELEQMEMQYFLPEAEAEASYEYWKDYAYSLLLKMGLPKERLRFRDHAADERAHYAKAALDIEYKFPMGFKELHGIHNRSDFDLSQHAKFSGKDLTFFDEATKTRFMPHVIESSVGVGRLMLALIHAAYHEEEVNGETRVVLRFRPETAPIKVAVLPLSKKEELTGPAKEVFAQLAGQFRAEYDETQSIGKRYRRQDEIGTPLCVTFDFDSLEDKAVTIRHRDTMEQRRVKVSELPATVAQMLREF
jgi:glycyl-tRNA synthetase